jgi:hypothetical protein
LSIQEKSFRIDSAGYPVDGNATPMLKRGETGVIRRPDSFRTVRFSRQFYRNDSWGKRDTNDSIGRGAVRIQRCGRGVVDCEGNHVSRSRGYYTFVPHDSDVAIGFSHALGGRSLGITFDQDGHRGVDIFSIAFVGNGPLEIKEPGDPLGLYRLRHIVGKLALCDCVLSLGVFEDKC